MKRIISIFSVLALILATSFTAAPETSKLPTADDWVYGLKVKPVVTDPVTIVQSTYEAGDGWFEVSLQFPSANYARTMSVKVNWYHPNYPGTPKYRSFYANNVSIPAGWTDCVVIVYKDYNWLAGGYISGTAVTYFQ